MATSAVQICSNALLLLGADPINAFNDENDRALLASNLWPNSRDAILRLHSWSCAIKRVELAPDVEEPAYEWTYQFTKPSDWMRTLAVGEEGEHVEFRHEGGKILCDENPLQLRYVYRNENVASWDALLVSAAEAYMAVTFAYPVTKSKSVYDAMKELLTLKLRQAKTIDGQEEPGEQVGDFPFLDTRTI